MAESSSPVSDIPQEEIEKKMSSSASDSTFSSLGQHEPLTSTGADLEKVQSRRSNLSRQDSRLTRTATNALSTIRSRKPFAPFSHPLQHAPTTADVIVEFDGPD